MRSLAGDSRPSLECANLNERLLDEYGLGREVDLFCFRPLGTGLVSLIRLLDLLDLSSDNFPRDTDRDILRDELDDRLRFG